MSYFNDEQKDHIESLSKLNKEGKICPCGWYTKEECSQFCNSVNGSPEAESKARKERLNK